MKPELMMPVRIQIPNEPPKIIKKETPNDLRTLSVCPIRAVTDRTLTEMELRVLLMFCAYTNKAGLTWVGLQRIAEHFNIGVPRAHRLTKSLINKGYMRVVHGGFRGERAHTRQVVFDPAISAELAAQNAGDKAPYMIEAERKAVLKKQRKHKSKVVDQLVSNLAVGDGDSGDGEKCTKVSEQHPDLSQLDPDILTLARQHAGQDADPLAILEAAERLLR